MIKQRYGIFPLLHASISIATPTDEYYDYGEKLLKCPIGYEFAKGLCSPMDLEQEDLGS